MFNKGKISGIRWNRVLAVVFIASSIVLSALSVTFMYRIFSVRTEEQTMEELDADTNQMNALLGSWIHNMIAMSDAVYYDIVADVDLQEHDLTKGFELLYDANQSYVENIALFTEEGELVLSVPDASLKEDADAAGQEWFRKTISKSGNIYFYDPHVQNLFAGAGEDYKWTLPMCRPVLLTVGTAQVKGILRFDLKYTSLEQMMENAIPEQSGSVYVTDREGNLIYHPDRWLLTAAQKEECRNTALKGCGNFREGDSYISIQDIGYTGWIMVNIREQDLPPASEGRRGAFYLMMAMIFVTIAVLINMQVSYFVTQPFRRLEKAVQQIRDGDMDVSVRRTGVYEVDSLGSAIVQMAAQIKELIKNINEEHEKKRRMEMDTLQSQINPHFLYNTLDVIVWLIENGKPREAAKAVVMLAKFFRISLSKGQNVISVREEMEHVKSYLLIQNLKYKNRFTWHIEMAEETAELRCIKLILQPLVENAIGHGIVHMEEEGEIWVRSFIRGEELLLAVKDNGCGMMKETVERLLKGEIEASSGHSGIGVKNVNQRIKLYYGEKYGLEIWSEFDEGTEITVHLPIVAGGKEILDEKD